MIHAKYTVYTRASLRTPLMCLFRICKRCTNESDVLGVIWELMTFWVFKTSLKLLTVHLSTYFYFACTNIFHHRVPPSPRSNTDVSSISVLEPHYHSSSTDDAPLMTSKTFSQLCCTISMDAPSLIRTMASGMFLQSTSRTTIGDSVTAQKCGRVRLSIML